MTVTAKRLISGAQLTDSAAPYYTAPAVTTAIVRVTQFSNPSNTPSAVTAWVVPAASTPTVANQYLNQLVLSPGETYTSPELSGVVLQAGDSIQAMASVNGTVVVMASGVEIT